MPAKSNKLDGRAETDSFDYMRTVVKGNSDPAWFIKEVLGVQLFPMQEKLIRDFYINRYDSSQPQKTQLILEAGQRSGKTALARSSVSMNSSPSSPSKTLQNTMGS